MNKNDSQKLSKSFIQMKINENKIIKHTIKNQMKKYSLFTDKESSAYENII